MLSDQFFQLPQLANYLFFSFFFFHLSFVFLLLANYFACPMFKLQDLMCFCIFNIIETLYVMAKIFLVSLSRNMKIR